MAVIDRDPGFDTLAAAKALREAGFDRRQAEAAADVMRASRDGLATADIAMLRADLYRALWIQTGMIERAKKSRHPDNASSFLLSSV